MAIEQQIQRGEIGGTFGPFPAQSSFRNESSADFEPSDSHSPRHLGLRTSSYNRESRYSTTGAELYPEAQGQDEFRHQQLGPPGTEFDEGKMYRHQSGLSYVSSYSGPPPMSPAPGSNAPPYSETMSSLLWTDANKENDDWLHDPGKAYGSNGAWGAGSMKNRRRPGFQLFSSRGFLNTFALLVLIGGLLTLFVGWPIIDFYASGDLLGGSSSFFGPGGTNASGQVGSVAGWNGLVDKNTPDANLKWTSPVQGDSLDIVFSDEFDVDGRTFFPGDDPFWEGVDLHYWATADLEWYHPDAMTTKDGNLEITMTEEPINGLNFKSGMLQSWNKFCFTGGYIEVNVSLPGNPNWFGLWPGLWTIGNLGRPGYGATNDGVWPYSYDACDVGTYPNQTRKDNTPSAALTSGSQDYGGTLAYSPGQRLSSCTCPNSDHPGPLINGKYAGRAAPEIDVLESQSWFNGKAGASVSQSIQIAPFDDAYEFKNDSSAITIMDTTNSAFNHFKGAVYQESVSVVTSTSTTAYNGVEFKTYGFDYKPGKDGWITWYYDGQPTWTMTAAAIGANTLTEISQRIVAEEPMSIVINFAYSTKFQGDPSYGSITFPQTMYLDYVRVYQRGETNVGCDPKDHPTAQYINDHPEAYQNPLRTTWAQAGYSWPVNGDYDTCP